MLSADASRFLRWNLLVTDVGFLVYWTVSASHALPAEWLYKDHDDPIFEAWNWSVAPVDVTASVLGLLALDAREEAGREVAAINPRW